MENSRNIKNDNKIYYNQSSFATTNINTTTTNNNNTSNHPSNYGQKCININVAISNTVMDNNSKLRMNSPKKAINQYYNNYYDRRIGPINKTKYSENMLNSQINSNILPSNNEIYTMIPTSSMINNNYYMNIPHDPTTLNIAPNPTFINPPNNSIDSNRNLNIPMNINPSPLINNPKLGFINRIERPLLDQSLQNIHPTSRLIPPLNTNVYNYSNNRDKWVDTTPTNIPINCQCIGCVNTQDCGICAVCVTMYKFGGSFVSTSKLCIRRRCIYGNTYMNHINSRNVYGIDMLANRNNNFSIKSNQNLNMIPQNNRSTLPQLGYPIRSLNVPIKKLSLAPTTNKSTTNISQIMGDNTTLPPSKMIRIKHSLYCYATGCKKPALLKSKYCSKECGLKTNLNRLKMICCKHLADINFQNYPAHKHDELKIITIEHKLQSTITKMNDNKLLRLKLFEYFDNRPSSLVMGSKINISNLFTFLSYNKFTCNCCGHNFSVTNISKHVELCYTKIEKIYSYFTPVQSNQEFMCDKHLKKQDGYCKRLYSNCVDHKNLDKFQNNIICGFFLESNIQHLYCDNLPEKYNHVCTIPREKCIVHFGWERTRLANIEQILQNLNIYRNFLDERLTNTKIRMKNRKSLIDNYLCKS